LRQIGAPAMEPLIAGLKDADADVRQGAANALVGTGGSRACALEPILAAFRERNLAVIAGAFWCFIKSDAPGSEDALIHALRDFGRIEMAEAFLNSGNSKFGAAAREWATAKGYQIGVHLR